MDLEVGTDAQFPVVPGRKPARAYSVVYKYTVHFDRLAYSDPRKSYAPPLNRQLYTDFEEKVAIANVHQDVVSDRCQRDSF